MGGVFSAVASVFKGAVGGGSKKKKVTPKQGRVVIFDGGLYHTAQQSLKKIRCIVNYNLG